MAADIFIGTIGRLELTRDAMTRKPTLYTVGHSSRTREQFIELLLAHRISTLIDIRTIPRSRHVPQFNTTTLPRALAKHGIAYRHMPSLGGLRKARKDSVNTAWKNASFRGFADYMQTAEFAAAIGDLIKVASKRPTAVMCAEAVPWRCHRSLIGDAMLARKWNVLHLMSPTNARPHKRTPFARRRGEKITYPAKQRQSRHRQGQRGDT